MKTAAFGINLPPHLSHYEEGLGKLLNFYPKWLRDTFEAMDDEWRHPGTTKDAKKTIHAIIKALKRDLSDFILLAQMDNTNSLLLHYKNAAAVLNQAEEWVWKIDGINDRMWDDYEVNSQVLLEMKRAVSMYLSALQPLAISLDAPMQKFSSAQSTSDHKMASRIMDILLDEKQPSKFDLPPSLNPKYLRIDKACDLIFLQMPDVIRETAELLKKTSERVYNPDFEEDDLYLYTQLGSACNAAEKIRNVISTYRYKISEGDDPESIQFMDSLEAPNRDFDTATYECKYLFEDYKKWRAGVSNRASKEELDKLSATITKRGNRFLENIQPLGKFLMPFMKTSSSMGLRLAFASSTGRPTRKTAMTEQERNRWITYKAPQDLKKYEEFLKDMFGLLPSEIEETISLYEKYVQVDPHLFKIRNKLNGAISTLNHEVDMVLDMVLRDANSTLLSYYPQAIDTLYDALEITNSLEYAVDRLYGEYGEEVSEKLHRLSLLRKIFSNYERLVKPMADAIIEHD